VVAWPGFAASVATKVLHKKRPALIPILDNEAIFGAYMSPTWPEQRASMESVYSPSRIREALDWIWFDVTRPENEDVWPVLNRSHPSRTRIELFDMAWWMQFRSVQPGRPADLGPTIMIAHTESRAGQMLEVLRAMCGNAATPSLVEQYFAPGRFAGRTFIDLAPNDPYWIGEADLLAVTLLDVSFPPASVRWFLDLTNQSTLSDLLRALPSPASELHTLEHEALAGGDGLWRLFARHEAPPGTTFTRLDEELRGIGPVKADKLMARKRPGIFPIYDRAFEELFGHGEGFDYWDATMWVLRDDTVRESLLSLVDGVPVVRILDAVVWMWQSRSENAERARSRAGVRGGAPWQPSKSLRESDRVDRRGTGRRGPASRWTVEEVSDG